MLNALKKTSASRPLCLDSLGISPYEGETYRKIGLSNCKAPLLRGAGKIHKEFCLRGGSSLANETQELRHLRILLDWHT